MNKKRILYAVLSVLIILIATFFIAIEEHNTDADIIDINLYFFNETEETIVAEPRQIKYNNENHLVNTVMEELKAGPKNNKNKPILEQSIEVLSIKENNRDITVDLSEQFVTNDNSKTLLLYRGYFPLLTTPQCFAQE